MLKQLDTSCLNSNLENILIEWLSYKDDRKNFLTERSINILIKKINNSAEKYGEQKVIDVIEESISNNWQGIIYEKLEKGGIYKNDKPKEQVKNVWGHVL